MLQSVTLFGNTIMLYNPINTIAELSMILLMFLFIREYKAFCTFPVLIGRYMHKNEKKNPLFLSFLVAVEIIVYFMLCFALSKFIIPYISALFLGDRSDNFFLFIFVIPIAFFIFSSILFRLPPLKFWDFTVPSVNLALILFKIACFCAGCCYGIGYDGPLSVFNCKNNRNELPIQLIEAGEAVIILIILFILKKRKKKVGTMYPTFMLLYSGMRFVSEFWRDDYPAVWGRLTGYHIQCIIGFILGVIYLLVVLKWGERINAYFETKNKSFLEKKLALYEKKHPQKSVKGHPKHKSGAHKKKK